MKLKSTLFLLSSTFISIFSFAQTIQENDYTLNYVDNKIQINFNKGVSLKAFDNKSQIQKNLLKSQIQILLSLIVFNRHKLLN
jgi:hypothetical protein